VSFCCFQNLLDPSETREIFRFYLLLPNRQKFVAQFTDGIERDALLQMRAAFFRTECKFPDRAKDLVVGGFPRTRRRLIQRGNFCKTIKLDRNRFVGFEFGAYRVPRKIRELMKHLNRRRGNFNAHLILPHETQLLCESKTLVFN
jgi:hypothetical protein